MKKNIILGILFFLFVSGINAQNCAIACLDKITTIYEGSPVAIWGADVMEQTCGASLTWELFDERENSIYQGGFQDPYEFGEDYIGREIRYVVTDPAISNACWGTILILPGGDGGEGNCVLACEAEIVVNVTENYAKIFYANFLANNCDGVYSVVMTDEDSNIIAEDKVSGYWEIDDSYVGNVYTYTITDDTGNTCWGQVSVVDKGVDGGNEGGGDNGGEVDPSCSSKPADFSTYNLPLTLEYDSISRKDLNLILDEMYEVAFNTMIEESFGTEDDNILIGYAYDETFIELEEGYAAKIIRNVTLIDWCFFDPTNASGGIHEVTQIIKINHLLDFDMGNSIVSDDNEMITVSSIQLESNNQVTEPKYSCSASLGEVIKCTIVENEWSGDFDVNFRKDGSCLNGVSTLDLVLIQKHVLGLENFVANTSLIAGDINLDGLISAADLISLRRMILGLADCNEIGWEFYKNEILTATDFSLEDKSLYHTTYNTNSLDAENFGVIGVKRGDINNSATPGYTSAESRSKLTLTTPNTTFERNEIIKIPIMSSDIESIISGKFVIALEEGNEIIEVDAGQLEFATDNIVLEGNAMTAIWYSMETVELVPSEPLFYISVLSSNQGTVRSILSEGKSVSYIHRSETDINPTKSVIVTEDVSTLNTTNEVVVNAIGNKIEFRSKSEISDIQLFDLSGKQIIEINGLNTKEYNYNYYSTHAPQILIYQVKTSQGQVETGKVILI